MLRLQALVTMAAESSELHSATNKISTPGFAASSAREAGLAAVADLAAEQAEVSAWLKGRVPPLHKWIDAWAAASSTTSYPKEARGRQKNSEARVSLGVR